METIPSIQTNEDIQRNGTISAAQILHLKSFYSNALLGNTKQPYTAYE